MKYEEEWDECRMLVGEPCGVPQDSPDGLLHACVAGAECLAKRPGSTNLECRCEAGRVVDPVTKTCLPSYGASCRDATQCDMEKNMVCSIHNDGFGVCDCRLGMIWNERDRECHVLPGESCGGGRRKCSDHATCSPSSSNLCQCDPGFTVHRRTRTCVLTHGSPCDNQNQTQTHCNSETLLECHSPSINESLGSCQCLEGHEWSVAQETCLSLVSSSCRTSQGCTDHAFCNEAEVCECFPSYSPTPSKRCLLQVGSPCAGTGCNVYDLLECREGLCQCQGFALQDNQTCKSFVGGPCGLFPQTMTSVECYEGTECRLGNNSVSGTCQLSLVSRISNLQSSSVTLYVLIIVPVSLFVVFMLYLFVRWLRYRSR
jgi:hypothetical protein